MVKERIILSLSPTLPHYAERGSAQHTGPWCVVGTYVPQMRAKTQQG